MGFRILCEITNPSNQPKKRFGMLTNAATVAIAPWLEPKTPHPFQNVVQKRARWGTYRPRP